MYIYIHIYGYIYICIYGYIIYIYIARLGRLAVKARGSRHFPGRIGAVIAGPQSGSHGGSPVIQWGYHGVPQ